MMDVRAALHIAPAPDAAGWIEALTDEECVEIFWLYVDPPEPFLTTHAPALLGQAMRFALHRIAEADTTTAQAG